LAFIEGAKPRDEIESALVIQMACTHAAAMAVLGRLGGAHGSDRNIAAKASAAARLLRAYAAQVEALRRLRNGGSQFVRVEHVHVNEGGQAVIGNVRSRAGRLPEWGPAAAVVTTGPYAFVRHPGYTAGILIIAASGPALGSWLAAALVVIFSLPFLLHRAITEDRILQVELAGYSDYAARVRWRLLPGIWWEPNLA
jgi:protein-S-isoprenylcysteine O-methyltransferase Ste14